MAMADSQSGSAPAHSGRSTEPTISEVAIEIEDAQEQALIAWNLYRIEKANRRLLARYIRTLHRCDRLRNQMRNLLEKGMA